MSIRTELDRITAEVSIQSGLLDQAIAALQGKAAGGSSGGGRLPLGYTELAYLNTDGNQYIDMGWTPQVGDVFTVDSSLTSGNAESAFAGYPSQWEVYYKKTAYGMTPSAWGGDTKITTLQINNSSVSMGQRNTIKISFNTTQSTGTSYLFRYRLDSYPFVGRIYSATVENANGEKLRDFVPCIHPSGAYGMYDLANDVFYGNAGSGAFF